MANTEEIIRVVKEIENIQNHPGYVFDMAAYAEETDCGTAMCLAGWTVHLNGLDVKKLGPIEIHHEARKLLGLSQGEASEIFYSTEIRTTPWLKRRIQQVTGEKIW